MGDDITKETIINDLEHLIKLGLVEVISINSDGEFLYGATEKARTLSESEITAFLNEALDSDE